MIVFAVIIYIHIHYTDIILDKDNTIESLQRELDAGIYVQIYTDDTIARRTVYRNDSAHVFTPDCGGLPIIIKARTAGYSNE
jgi:hypothetical protein